MQRGEINTEKKWLHWNKESDYPNSLRRGFWPRREDVVKTDANQKPNWRELYDENKTVNQPHYSFRKHMLEWIRREPPSKVDRTKCCSFVTRIQFICFHAFKQLGLWLKVTARTNAKAQKKMLDRIFYFNVAVNNTSGNYFELMIF